VESLNYQHLFYFWMVGRTGSIAQAARELSLSSPTVSAQVKELELSMGAPLLRRSGRQVILTETGGMVHRYADEIFATGRELLSTLRGRSPGRPVRIHVGISDALPKVLVHHLLEPLLRHEEQPLMVCRGGRTEGLLAELAIHRFDLVLTDEPLPSSARIRAFSHRLGDCGVSFFAAGGLLEAGADFPACLDGAPFLMPAEHSPLRRSLEQWFEAEGLRVQVVAEFDDSALMKQFGRRGEGFFAAPMVVETDIAAAYGCRVVGRTDGITESFHAVTLERRIEHPSIRQLVESARTSLF